MPIYKPLGSKCAFVKLFKCLKMHVLFAIIFWNMHTFKCVYHNFGCITGMWEMLEAFSLLMKSRWALAGWAPTSGASSYREKILYQILLQWENLLEMAIQCHVWSPPERLPKASCHLEWSTSTQWGEKKTYCVIYRLRLKQQQPI